MALLQLPDAKANTICSRMMRMERLGCSSCIKAGGNNSN